MIFFIKLVTGGSSFTSRKCKDDDGCIDDNIFLFKEIFMGFLAFAKGITIVVGSVTPVGILGSVAVTVGGSIIGKAIANKIMK